MVKFVFDMKAIRIQFVVFFLLTSFGTCGQSLEKFAFSTGSTIQEDDSLAFAITVGESNVSLIQNVDCQLNQGFLSPKNLSSVTANIAEHGINFSQKIFPNPTTAYFSLKLDTKFENGKVYLLNGNGEIVKFWMTLNSKFPVNNLSSGLYLVRFISDNQIVFQERLIITE